MSQSIKTAFPVTVGSSQKLPLILSFPSLAFISWQDSAGNSGIEPKGAAVKYILSFSFLIINSCKWEETWLAQDRENVKKQKKSHWYIDLWFLTSAVQSSNVKPHGRLKEILWSRLLGAVI